MIPNLLGQNGFLRKVRKVLKISLGAAAMLAGMAALQPAWATEIVMIPKLVGIPYFTLTGTGAEVAAKELGITLTYNGPSDAKVEGQIAIIDQAIRRKVDAIAIDALDPAALAPGLKRARDAGIQVLSWDSDVDEDARSAFVDLAPAADIGRMLVESLAMDGVTSGEILDVTGNATAANLNAWIDEIKKHMAAKYPDMKIAAILADDQDDVKARNLVQAYLPANPQTKGIIVNTASLFTIVQVVKDLGLQGKIAVAGTSFPDSVETELKDGSLTRCVMWQPWDLGYATVYVADALIKGTFDPNATEFEAGQLGKLRFSGKGIVNSGTPMYFTKDNLAEFKR